MELFNRLCILPKTGWGIQLSDQGSSIVPSALTPEETHQYTSQFATTVGDILRDILFGIINSHSMKETIILCIPIRGGIPFSWFQSIIGPEYKDSHFTLAPLTTLRDRISRCLDHALQQRISSPTTRFFSSASGAYWKEAEEPFDPKPFYLQCCSEFPAHLNGVLQAKNTTLDKLAGSSVPYTRHYGVEAMVQDAYDKGATKCGMESHDLPLPNKTLVVGNNQSVDFNGRVLVVANRRQRRAIVGVKKEVFKKLLYS